MKQDTVKKRRKLKPKVKLKLYQMVILINILWILLLCIYYGYRLIYFYQIEHKVNTDTNLLVDTLLLDKNVVVQGDGLYKEDEQYIYKGNVNNNYISYDGFLWRIVSIDKDHNMKLITNEAVTTLGYGTNGYLDSPIHSWLNPIPDVNHTGIFLQNLKDYRSYQIRGITCTDKIDNLNKTTCKNVEKEYVGLLSLSEYEKAKGKNSYLNMGASFYTSSIDQDNNVWIISKDGTIISENSGTYGVRPTITIKASTKLISGNGTVQEPYKIIDNKVTKLSDSYVGEYLKLENSNYRIISQENNITKLVLDGTINNDRVFDYDNSAYDDTNYYNVGYYLNHAYLNQFVNSNLLLSTNFYIGPYYMSDYNYLKTYEKSVEAKVGLLQVGDYFISDYNHIYTLTPSNDDDNTIVTISSGKLYSDLTTNVKDLRPVIALSGDLKITGVGTKEKAYEVGES